MSKLYGVIKIPTMEESGIVSIGDTLYYAKRPMTEEPYVYHHVYFTSDEDISEGMTVICVLSGVNYGKVVQNISAYGAISYKIGRYAFRQIVACTDKSLRLASIPLQWIADVYVPSNGKLDKVCLETICEYGDECPSKGAYEKQHLCKASLRYTANNEVIVIPDATENFVNIVGGEHIIKNGIASTTPIKLDDVADDVWVFERSSGYAGYRNKNTGDWIYEHQYELIRRIAGEPAKIEGGELIIKDGIASTTPLEVTQDSSICARQEDAAIKSAAKLFAIKSAKELHYNTFNNRLIEAFEAGAKCKDDLIRNFTITEAAQEVADTIPYDVPVIAYKSAMNKCVEGSLSLFNRDYYRTGFYNGFLTAWKAKTDRDNSAEDMLKRAFELFHSLRYPEDKAIEYASLYQDMEKYFEGKK